MSGGFPFIRSARAQEGKTLTFAMAGTVTSSWDPTSHTVMPQITLEGSYSGRLTNCPMQKDEADQTLPDPATEGKLIDRYTLEYKLRRGVTCHDGMPFKAEDVANPNFLQERPDGTGPFRYVGTHGDNFTFKAFDNYHGGQPSPESIGGTRASCSARKGLAELERIVPCERGHLLQCDIHHLEVGGRSGVAIVHEGEETGYVLQGRVEILIDDVAYTLAAGDAFCFRSHRPHSYRNVGREPASILWTCTPPTF